MESVFYVLKSIGALILVIWLANVALKYMNKYSNNGTKSIQIIERISVSKTSSLAIVKIVDDFYLMSFSEKNSEVLERFSKKEAAKIERQQEKQKKTIKTVSLFNLTEVKEKYIQFFDRSN